MRKYQGSARFPEFAQNFSEGQILWSLLLGRFSHFYIAIAYSNSTFRGVWTPSFCELTWKLLKFQQNEHTPGYYTSFQYLNSIWMYSCIQKLFSRNIQM